MKRPARSISRLWRGVRSPVGRISSGLLSVLASLGLSSSGGCWCSRSPATMESYVKDPITLEAVQALNDPPRVEVDVKHMTGSSGGGGGGGGSCANPCRRALMKAYFQLPLEREETLKALTHSTRKIPTADDQVIPVIVEEMNLSDPRYRPWLPDLLRLENGPWSEVLEELARRSIRPTTEELEAIGAGIVANADRPGGSNGAEAKAMVLLTKATADEAAVRRVRTMLHGRLEKAEETERPPLCAALVALGERDQAPAAAQGLRRVAGRVTVPMTDQQVVSTSDLVAFGLSLGGYSAAEIEAMAPQPPGKASGTKL